MKIKFLCRAPAFLRCSSLTNKQADNYTKEGSNFKSSFQMQSATGKRVIRLLYFRYQSGIYMKLRWFSK